MAKQRRGVWQKATAPWGDEARFECVGAAIAITGKALDLLAKMRGALVTGTDENGKRWKELAAYYAENRDRMIVDGVWPLVGHLVDKGSQGTRVFVDRDFEGGPNVVIGLGGRSCDVDDLASHVKKGLKEWMGQNPSSQRAEPSEYAEYAAEAGAGQGRRSAGETPVQPDNSVLARGSDGSGQDWIDAGLREVLNGFRADVTPSIVSWLTRHRRGEMEKTEAAFNIMVTLIWMGDPTMLRGHMSFRSHARGVLAWWRASGLTEEFERAFRRSENRVCARLEETLSELGGGCEEDGALKTFVNALDTTWETVDEFIGEGRIEGPVGENNSTKLFRQLAATVEDRDADELADAAAPALAIFRESPILRVWQILVNLTYISLRQLGISPLERLMLGWHISRGAENLGSPEAREIGRLVTETRDGRQVVTRGT